MRSQRVASFGSYLCITFIQCGLQISLRGYQSQGSEHKDQNSPLTCRTLAITSSPANLRNSVSAAQRVRKCSLETRMMTRFVWGERYLTGRGGDKLALV